MHVVLRRLSFFTMSLTHATFPGLVIAELLGISLFTGTAVFGLVVVALIALLGASGCSTRRPPPASCWPAASPSASC